MNTEITNPDITRVMYTNKNTVYENTQADKDLIYSILSQKVDDALSKSGDIIGSKNLLYFTVFYKEEYIELLELCLESILKVSDTSRFDVLFITDSEFEHKIKAFKNISSFNCKFHIRKTPENGSIASIQKLKIFDFEGISEYKKILFLDCDIIIAKPLEDLFDSMLVENVLEVSPVTIQYKDNILVDISSKVCFTLGHRSSQKSQELINNKTIPFNSGHLAFFNTEQMRFHFENVYWIQQVWPGPYFFEQPFLNDYFFLDRNLCSTSVFSGKVSYLACHDIRQTKKTKTYWENDVLKYEVYIQDNSKRFVEKINSILEKNSEYSIYHFIGKSQQDGIKLACVKKFLEVSKLCQ